MFRSIKPAIAGALVVGAAILTAWSPAWSEEFIDEYATDLIRKMSDQLKAASALSFHVDATVGVPLDSGSNYHSSERVEIALRRPDRFVGTVQTDDTHRKAFYDGKTFTLWHVDEGMFASTKAKSNFDDTLDYLANEYGVGFPLVDLISADPYSNLMDGVTFGTYVGLHTANGVKCHHLVFQQEDLDWEIWIEPGLQMIPRKFAITYKDEGGAPEYIAYLSDWDLGAHLSDASFSFVAPPEAREIELSAVEAVGARGGAR